MMNDKLKYFPDVYYLSLEESTERQGLLHEQFSKYGIDNVTPILSKRFAECNDKVKGELLHILDDGATGCVISHLKAIEKWYTEKDDDYAIFCEDDVSLETVEYWNFTWEEFIEKLPNDAECVHLCTVRPSYDTVYFRERSMYDWSATIYMITRDYARKILERHVFGDEYDLTIPGTNFYPMPENVLFYGLGKVYTIELFVENTTVTTTFNEIEGGHKEYHKESYDFVSNWWKTQHTSLYQLFGLPEVKMKTELEELLIQYSMDTENPEYNFALGLWYEREGHTAPALSYFLRCAERTEDDILAYEALIHGSICYDRQGTREGTSKGLLQQALVLIPTRPEAYFLLAQFSEKRQWWQDCYIYAETGLKFADLNSKPLRTYVGYPGTYGLLFEKAVSGWWWGKNDESGTILKDLLENYNMQEAYYNVVLDNLKKYFPEYLTTSDFDYNNLNLGNFKWGDLTYEDIITIEREIVHEKVYRFWKDVKEGDVVLDIGASVGAYTISILDQKPKKVYCVEPSKKLLKTLVENCFDKVLGYKENPLVYINCGIVDKDDDKINIFGEDKTFNGITFKNMIEEYSITHVDYMKIDCEGGEYSIFKEENMDFLLNNVEFIAMEVHLNYEGCREKFKNLRDNYLTRFNNYKVMSCTRQNISWGQSIDIKDKIFDDKFIDEYTCEFMVYISKN